MYDKRMRLWERHPDVNRNILEKAKSELKRDKGPNQMSFLKQLPVGILLISEFPGLDILLLSLGQSYEYYTRFWPLLPRKVLMSRYGTGRD